MEPSFSYSVAQAGFIILTIIMFVLLLLEFKKAVMKTSWEEARRKRIVNRVLIAIIGWTAFITILSLSGFLQNFSAIPPRLVIVLAIPLITIIGILFSTSLKDVLQQIPPSSIVRLQFFRVFVEILLWFLFIQNMLPVQMTFEGRNFDVLVGLTAPLAAYVFTKYRGLLIAWNFISLAVLANIIIIAVLSIPSPFRVFMNEPANTIVTYFPFVWLPGLLVPLAYGLHFLSLKQLLTRN